MSGLNKDKDHMWDIKLKQEVEYRTMLTFFGMEKEKVRTTPPPPNSPAIRPQKCTSPTKHMKEMTDFKGFNLK